jgi:hypothetical protein
MRRKVVPLLALVSLLLLWSTLPASAGPALPSTARPRGQTYVEWARDIGQFYLGDASNPLIAGLEEGACGQLIDGVFFMAAPIDVGVEFDCEIPVGTPIVISHAGFFTFEDAVLDTDAELIAAADEGFTFTSNSLTVDGVVVALPTVHAGAFNVISESGSFYDSVIGVGTGPIRTALTGNVVFLHPLAPGEHTIEAEVTFTGDGGAFSATYHLDVG